MALENPPLHSGNNSVASSSLEPSSSTPLPTGATTTTPTTRPSTSNSQPSNPIASTPTGSSTPRLPESIVSPPPSLTRLPQYFTRHPLTTLLISPAHTPVYIHTDLLTSLSPFFRAALSPEYGFRESKEHVVVLEEEYMEDEHLGKYKVEQGMVEWFVRWAYAWGVDAEAERAPTGVRKDQEEWGEGALWCGIIDKRVESIQKWREECKEVRARRKRKWDDRERKEEAEDSPPTPLDGSSSNPSTLSELFTGLNTSSDDFSTALRPTSSPLKNCSFTTSTAPLPSTSTSLPPRPHNPSFSPLIRLYLFADRNDIPILRSHIRAKVLWISQQVNGVPNPGDVWLIWANTMPFSRVSSPKGGIEGGSENERRERMRQLILDLYRGNKTGRLVRGEFAACEAEEGSNERVMEGFWRELVMEMMEERDKKTTGDGKPEDGDIVIGKGNRAVRRPKGFYDEP